MTMPDYIKITYQPKTMDTPTIRAALTSDDICPGPLSEDDLRRGWNQQADEHNQWESLDSAEQLAWAQARAIAADRALSQPSAETSATGALTDIQLWELLPKRLEQNLLAMVQLAAPHYKLKPIDLLQDIAPDFVDYARAVLASDRARRIAQEAEPKGRQPTDEDLYDLAEQFHGDPVPAMRRALELWGGPLQGAPATGENPATPPAPEGGGGPTLADVDELCAKFGFHCDDSDSLEMLRDMIAAALARWVHTSAAAPAPGENPAAPPAPETLAARPLLERVAQLGDVIGRQTVAQVQQLANQAAAWLRENPPGQPVAIEPRGCPTPGEVGELVEFLTPTREQAGAISLEAFLKLRRAATLLQQQESELATLKDDGWAKAMTNLVDQIGGDGPSLWEWGASIPTPPKSCRIPSRAY